MQARDNLTAHKHPKSPHNFPHPRHDNQSHLPHASLSRAASSPPTAAISTSVAAIFIYNTVGKSAPSRPV